MSDHQSGQVVPSAAQVYERFFVPALFAAWPIHVLQAAQVQEGDSVLDVACGTGILARAAAERVGPRGAVVGVDINEGMLTVARQTRPDLTWQLARAEKLPFDARSFDRVVSQFGLMFFEEPERALAEMRRVLRPGGTVGVAVWDSLAANRGYAVMAEILNDLFGAEFAQSIQAPYALGDSTTLAALFDRAGWTEWVIQTVSGVAHFDSVEAWLYTDIKGWTLADVITDEAYQTLHEYAPQHLAPFIQADGSVAFSTSAHIVTAVAAP